MGIKKEWLYPSSISEAIQCQAEMASLVIKSKMFSHPLATIAGVDVSNNLFDPEKNIYASTVMFNFPHLTPVETVTMAERQEFPYISGLLGFREAPTLVKLFKQLSKAPDLLMVDGQGISHPRGLGLASHLGVLLDLPTIGVAKSILVGSPLGTLGEEAGSQTPLIWKDQIIGMVVRTKKRCLPLIVSPGHKIDLEEAVDIVLKCLKGYRLPEPTRHAHLAANVCRLKNSQKNIL